MIAIAALEDRHVLHALLAAQLREHHIALDDAALTRAIEGPLADPSKGAFLLLREQGQPIGVAWLSRVWALEHGGAAVWLEELYVVPDRRGLGHGTALLRFAIDWARREGLAAIDLEVEADHARAANLYEREGWRRHTRSRYVLALRQQ